MERGLRADARRNRDHILIAAREIFVDQGPDAPLEAIAERAGVGIATLYRRFPDRRILARALVLELLRLVTAELSDAVATEPDAFRALARYMHGALDLRIAAAIPALLDLVDMDEPEIFALRQESAAIQHRIIKRAQADGALRPDVTFGDIGLLLSRLSRPLAGRVPRATSDEVAHRHLDLLLDGLRARRDQALAPLPGPALTLGELRALPAEPEPGAKPGDCTKSED